MQRRMRIRVTVCVVLLMGLATMLNAQERKVKNLTGYDRKPVHFGFTLGLNTMDFLIYPNNRLNASPLIYSVENQKMPGFNLGPIANFRLGRYFDFRTLIVLSFGQRNLQYRISEDAAGSGSLLAIEEMQIESTFLELPMLIKYKASRLNNFRPYLIAGGNPKIDLAARKEIKDEDMPQIRLQNYDIYYEVGIGADFYLPYFKFSAEIKYSQGLLNVMKPDETPYTKILDKIHSRMIMLSFHFE